MHIAGDVLVADAGWLRSRLPTMPEGYDVVAPDWVCETLGRDTVELDRVHKMAAYARHGVKHLWLVDPLNQTLEVFTLDGTGWRLAGTFAGDDKVRAVPFDAIELELGLLWQL